MITLDPIARALVAADSEAADKLGAPNYDEFQSDREVWELLRENRGTCCARPCLTATCARL